MNDDASIPAACRRCGCPLAGNESYCSNCGRRVDGRGSVTRAVAVGVFILGLVTAGTCVRSRSRGAHSGRSSDSTRGFEESNATVHQRGRIEHPVSHGRKPIEGAANELEGRRV